MTNLRGVQRFIAIAKYRHGVGPPEGLEFKLILTLLFHYAVSFKIVTCQGNKRIIQLVFCTYFAFQANTMYDNVEHTQSLWLCVWYHLWDMTWGGCIKGQSDPHRALFATQKVNQVVMKVQNSFDWFEQKGVFLQFVFSSTSSNFLEHEDQYTLIKGIWH